MLKHDQSISWIASYPKSGNTWVRAFIDALTFSRLDINNMLVPSDASATFLNFVSGKPVDQLSVLEQKMLRPAALHFATCAWNYSVLPHPVLKTHWAWSDDFCIPRPLTGKSVYLVRDVRDIAISYARHSDKTIDEVIERLSEPRHGTKKGHIEQHLGTWSEHVLSWIRHEDVVRLFRYEDMISDSLGVFSEIQGHLEIEGDTQKAVALASLENLKKAEEENDFVERFGEGRFFGNATDWRQELSKEQSDRLWRNHKAVLIMLGYEK